MSLSTFKKKSVITYGSRRSAKPGPGIWLPQGPFGKDPVSLELALKGPGYVGFSLNGPYRNVGRVGKTYHMSKNGTPFKGEYPRGWGGTYGKYATPLPSFNVNEVIVEGQQYKYIKPSVLTGTLGLIHKKYRWAHSGQYPNNWVQPNYTGWQTDTKSQGNYIHTLAAANCCNFDINKTDKYVGNIKIGGPTLCQTTPARFTYNDMIRNGRYTKYIYNPLDASQYTQLVSRKCNNPIGVQKPFPFGVNGNCWNKIFVTPPKWYTNPKDIGLQA